MDPITVIFFLICLGVGAYILTLLLDMIPMLAPFNQIIKALIYLCVAWYAFTAIWPMLKGMAP